MPLARRERSTSRAWCALTAIAVGTGLGVVALAQQAPDRSRPPAVGPPPELRLPAIEKRTLTNGLQVWIAGVHKVPTVHLELAIRSGSAADPKGHYGLASMTADMLDEGAGARSALEVADGIDYLGAELSADASIDASYVDLRVPVARLGDALPIMADVVARPTFPADELKRLREERLASLLEAQDDPEQLVQFAFPRVVFGAAHRYGSPVVGTASSLRALTVADLKAFHAAHYRPTNARLIVAGDVSAATIVPLLERAFRTWTGGAPAAAATRLPEAPQLTGRRVYLVDKPDAAQSQVRIGWIGVARSTPDYFALRVLNTVLGEAFTSRLNMNLREVHGYSYGASSRFDMRRTAGPFYAAAGVQSDKTVDALKEFFVELTNIHETLTPEELEKARNYLARQLPRSFETERATAGALAEAYVYDLPADYFQTYAARVAAVTAEDVKRAADKYIQPDKLAVVIVGDRKAIEAGVRSLNLGPVTVIEPSEIFK